MPEHKTDFNKSLRYCIISLVLIILIGGYTSKTLDGHSETFNELIDISGETRMLSQRISLKLIKTNQAENLEQFNINKSYLNEAISRLEKIQGRLVEIEKDDSQIRSAISEFHKRLYNDAYTNEELIDAFVKSTQSVSDYFQSSTDLKTTRLTDIKDDLNLISTLSENGVLKVFQEKTTFYLDLAEQLAKKNRIIKLFFVAFYSTLIFIVVILSFYPLHKKMRSLLNVMDRQKEHFETERNRLQLASQATTTGIWDWDIKSNGFYWNDVLKEIFGLKDEKGNTYDVTFFQSILHPDDKDRFKSLMRAHIKEKVPFIFEGRIKHHISHNYMWIRFRGQALWKDDGVAHRMTGSVQDVTTEKEVEIQRDIFIQGIEAANIAFAIIDLKTKSKKFSYANNAFCNLTSYDYKKITSSNMGVFTGPKTSMNDLDQIDYALKNKEELSLKIISYRYDGTEYHNQIILRPIFINQKFSNYFIVIFNDLTDTIKNQKQEIERQRNESLGSLAGSVAHEINNLLMPMTMAEDILEDELKEDCDPFAREQIKTIVEYANQAKAIVNGILTFSRKETGNLKRVKLYDDVFAAVQFIQSLLSSKTTLALHKTDHVDVEAMINQTEMKQIITNLCKNAEQAFENKSGTIDISFDIIKLTKEEKTTLDVIATELALISVTDDGQGIPEDNLKKIFEPLFTTKAIGEGTGLGLSVVIGIVRSWGGGITVDSVLGQGTTFNIYIPVYKDSDDFSDLIDIIEDLENQKN